MKPIRSLMLLPFMAVVFAACQRQAVDRPHIFPLSNDSILCRADIAQEDIKYLCNLHDSAGSSFVKDLPISFTIRAKDLFAAMGLPYDSTCSPYSHIRVYSGYRIAGEAGTRSQEGFKLYIVPVSGVSKENPSGHDELLQRSGKDFTVAKPDIGQLSKQYVLDLNAPCPSTCDMTSPLYPANN